MQKTSYELRISDWSSDVCSSDLVPLRRGDGRQPCGGLGRRPALRQHLGLWRHRRHEPQAGQGDRREDRRHLHRGDRSPRGRRGRESPAGGEEEPAPADRKSVGEGKGGSGRVDSGGGRIMKQKTRIIKQNKIKARK